MDAVRWPCARHVPDPQSLDAVARVRVAVEPEGMDDVARLRQMADEIRAIRDRTCEPKNSDNRRYLNLSNAVSGLNKAAADIENEQAQAAK